MTSPSEEPVVSPRPPRTPPARGWLGLLLAVPVACWIFAAGNGRETVFNHYSLRAFVGNVLVSYAAAVMAYLWYAPAAFRKKLFIVITLSGMGCFTWAVLEIPVVFHWIDYRILLATPFHRSWENPRNRLDRELLHIHTPYDRFTGTIPGDLVAWYGIDTDRRYEVDVRYDKRGFRNRIDRDRADIVMIGDSFVEGPIVPYDQIASTLLEKRLRRSVLNLGQTGYGPQQEAVVLRRFAWPAKPLVIVWILFEGNDLIHDFARYQRSIANWNRFAANCHGFFKRSFTRNVLKLLARKTSTFSRDPSQGLARSGILETPGRYTGQRLYFAYAGHPLSPQDEQYVTQAWKVLCDCRQFCAERGIHFLLVFAPTKYRVYHDLCSFSADSAIAGWVVNDLAERIARESESKGIACLDLTPALHEAAQKGTLVYYLDDGHWNAQGHAVAASQIASFLRHTGWLNQVARKKNLLPRKRP